MPGLVEFHGLTLVPELITGVSTSNRSAIAYPVYEEIETGKTRFGRTKTAIRFVGHVPYGIILEDNEKPATTNYIMNTDTGKLIHIALDRLTDPINKAAILIANGLGIDRSAVRQYRIMMKNRNIKTITLDEIPAKLKTLEGRLTDVWRSDYEKYNFPDGDPNPVIDYPVKALVVTTKQSVHVMFGGFDLPEQEVEQTFQKILNLYNDIHSPKPIPAINQENLLLKNTSVPGAPKLKKPKKIINLPFVANQSSEKQEKN